MSSRKKPRSKHTPSAAKKPVVAENPDSSYQKKPSWRIGALEMCDPYGWHAIDVNTLRFIRSKLSNFESMTWYEILVKGKKFHHSVSRGRLSKDAQKRLTDLKQDDVDELISLRLAGIKRVWGIQEADVLRLLWWDPNHKVCPSLKKHT